MSFLPIKNWVQTQIVAVTLFNVIYMLQMSLLHQFVVLYKILYFTKLWLGGVIDDNTCSMLTTVSIFVHEVKFMYHDPDILSLFGDYVCG